jgi:phenazine biosynthesis protein phzE
MATLRAAVERLLQREQPFLAVCLGHQALCHTLGLPLAYKDIVFQGTQSALKVDGRTERVGFYNTFVGRVGDDTVLPEGVIVDADAETGDVHVLRGPHYTGIQFHAESILTQRGDGLLHEIVARLLG